MNNERDVLVKAIQCVLGCHGLRDREFCEVFSQYCGYPRVL